MVYLCILRGTESTGKVGQGGGGYRGKESGGPRLSPAGEGQSWLGEAGGALAQTTCQVTIKVVRGAALNLKTRPFRPLKRRAFLASQPTATLPSSTKQPDREFFLL